MRVGLHILKPETATWLPRQLQRGELCAASACKTLPRLATHLRLELLAEQLMRWTGRFERTAQAPQPDSASVARNAGTSELCLPLTLARQF